MTEHQRVFVREMNALTDGGQRRTWEVFQDFCELSYCAIAKPSVGPERQEKLESRYMRCVKRYSREQVQGYVRMLGITGIGLSESGAGDFLGTIYEESGFCERKIGGQFWTPWNVAYLMASVTVQPAENTPPVELLAEPTCGSGRLVLATATAMRETGRDPLRHLWADASDIDVVCAQMTFIQMAYAGIPGIVRHANTISLEVFDQAITPAGISLLAESEYLREQIISPPADPPKDQPATTAPTATPTPALPAPESAAQDGDQYLLFGG